MTEEKLTLKDATPRLGEVVVDRVTGFKGMITGVAEYITGCVQYCVQPQKLTEKGEIAESVWLDEGRVTEEGYHEAAKGGPQDNPAPTKWEEEDDVF